MTTDGSDVYLVLCDSHKYVCKGHKFLYFVHGDLMILVRSFWTRSYVLNYSAFLSFLMFVWQQSQFVVIAKKASI